MSRIDELLARAARDFERAGVPSPRREAALLLGAILERPEIWLIAHGSELVSPARRAGFDELVRRRLDAEPTAYLLGSREFFGRRFQVDRRVLIPRPETEHLIEAALALDLPADARVLDLGTGSGAIAITLAAERPNWSIVGSDLSVAALAVAATNARRFAVGSRVAFVAQDLARSVRLGAFDLLISNPPYVARREAAALPPDVARHEPALALFGGEDGLQAVVEIVDAARRLKPGAHLALEIGAGQLEAVVDRAERGGELSFVASVSDLAGIARDVVFRKRDG